MPTYSHVPPAEPTGVGMPIQRTPTARTLKAIITSDDIIGCNTHFWHGKTMPCDALNCEPCQESVPFRWHAYCSAFIPQTNLHFLYECTAAAAEEFVKYRHDHGTLRGCLFSAYRWRQRPNGRVIIRTEQSGTPLDSLPKAPNLEKTLAVLWQLPDNNVQTGDPTAFGKQVAANTKVPGQNTPPQT